MTEPKTPLRIALRVAALERSLSSLKKFLELKEWDYAIDELSTIMSTADCAINYIEREKKKNVR